MASDAWLWSHATVALALLLYAGTWALNAWRWSRTSEPEAVDALLLAWRDRRLLGLDRRAQGWLLLLAAMGTGVMIGGDANAASVWLALKLCLLVGLAMGAAFFLRRPQPAMAYFLLGAVLAIALLSLPLLS